MIPEVSRRTVAVGLGVALLVVLLAGGGLAMAYDQPQVESVESEFADVEDDSASVDTTVVVHNPNDRPIPGRLDIGYAVALNGVEVASGTEGDVRIEPGRNTIETTARFDNSKIPAWWVSHVNNGERTTMKTEATVGIVGSLGPTVTAEERTIETDLLGPLADSGESTVHMGNHSVLVVGDQRAEWARANETETPIRFTTELENVHDRPVTLDGTDYEVRMNGVVVGEGETTEGIELAPGESGTFEVRAALDTQTMQEWWVTHLRNDQSTDMRIEVYAVADDGETRERLPVTVFERHATFETDFLGDGRTAVELRESPAPPEFAEPRVEDTHSEWGAVRDDETEIETTVDVVNPNDEAFSDLLTLSVTRRTTLAGVTIVESTDRVDELPQNSGQVTVTATKPHSVVPEWWAAHLRNGETSEMHTELTGEADVGVTTFPVELSDRSSTVETHLLSDLNSDDSRAVRSEETGRRLLTVHSTSARWQDPTPENATIVVEADISNEQLSDVTIEELDYTFDLNSVRLADDRAPQSHTFGPRERRTVTFTMTLDNSKMADWWPTHVENGEVSELDRQVVATVESGGESERVELDFLSESSTVETDLLAE